jgi:hypothetical protein
VPESVWEKGLPYTCKSVGVPLLPAALQGLDRLSRFDQLLLRFGAPILLDDLDELSPHAAAVEATRRLWTEIVLLGSQ